MKLLFEKSTHFNITFILYRKTWKFQRAKKITRSFNLNSIFPTINLIICFCEIRIKKILINHKLGASDQRPFTITYTVFFKLLIGII